MTFSVSFCLYNESILALTLYTKYGASNTTIGICFTMGAVSYMVVSSLIGYISYYVRRRHLILTGFMLMVLHNLFLGPSWLIGLGDHEMYLFFGMALMGIGLAFAFVPTLAEMIDILEGLDNGKYDTQEISDLSVGVFNSMFSLGNLLAPLIGGVLNHYYDYMQTCNIVAFLSLGFSVIFYLTMILNKEFT
jgi:MFS family permease